MNRQKPSRSRLLQGGLLAACLALVLLTYEASPPPVTKTATKTVIKTVAQPINPVSERESSSAVRFETHEADGATVYMLAISQPYLVSVAVSDGLQTVETFSEQTNAFAILNAGFFDPQNAQTTSHVVIEGEAVADPAENERLVGNLDLAPYLSQIFNRSEFRRYDCAGEPRYDITPHEAPAPENCTLVEAVGAGPQLLPENTAYVEGFTDYADGALIRDAIGSESRNARTAVGIKADGSVVWFMVAQNPGAGMTLAELAQFMRQRGVVKGLNLDGGSSASMVFNGTAYYGKFDSDGNPVQRPVKSVLTVD
ncbi:MAG: phosphodiester glycosidase family protein [Cyanobacteria bacterium P01_A01_bin.114]